MIVLLEISLALTKTDVVLILDRRIESVRITDKEGFTSGCITANTDSPVLFLHEIKINVKAIQNKIRRWFRVQSLLIFNNILIYVPDKITIFNVIFSQYKC